jgi:GntR family transcriptional repressor for pyruvate dehydrogenase complex
MIADGTMVPGSKLPPERTLAQRLKVSRSSLRQALKVLTIMGVLSQRVGDGTYFNGKAFDLLEEPIDLLITVANISHSELYEARLIIEPELAARAAERATAQDITALRRAIAAMQKYATSEKKIIDFDVSFHQSVFEAAGNRLCQAMFGVLHKALLTSISRTTKMVDVNHTVRFHEAICSAIDRRQPQEARQKMIEHLLDARRILLEFDGERGRPPRRAQLALAVNE